MSTLAVFLIVMAPAVIGGLVAGLALWAARRWRLG